MKKKFIKFVISEPVFKSNCTFLLNCTFTKLNNFRKKHGFEGFEKGGENASVTIDTDKDGVKYFLLWIQDFDWTCNDIGRLAHEITHLVIGIMLSKGIDPSKETEEVLAYLIDFYMRSAAIIIKEKI